MSLRSAAVSVTASLVGLVVALLLVEGLVRVFFDEPVQPRFVVDGGYGVRANKPDVDTRHYVPGDYDVRITTNASGMRGQEDYPVERVPGKRRVLMLGDSFPFGYGVEDGEVVSAALEGLLNQAGQPGDSWEVVNLAVAGFGQAEELVTWGARAKDYQPDVVVLFYFENDIGNNAVANLYRVNAAGRLERTGEDFLPGTNLQDSMLSIAPVRWLFEHSEAWNLIRNRLSSLVQRRLMKDKGLQAYDDASPKALALTRALLAELVAQIRQSGAEVVFVVIPNKRGMQSGFPLTPQEVAALGARLVDGRDYLSPDDYYQRDNHWKPSGHRKTAEQLADLLRNSP